MKPILYDTYIDYYSRMKWVTLLRKKYEALDKFKDFKSMAKNEMDTKIKFLSSNRGGNLHQMNLISFVKIIVLGDIHLLLRPLSRMA